VGQLTALQLSSITSRRRQAGVEFVPRQSTYFCDAFRQGLESYGLFA